MAITMIPTNEGPAATPAVPVTVSGDRGDADAIEDARRFFDRVKRELAYAEAERDYERRVAAGQDYAEALDRDEFRRRYGA